MPKQSASPGNRKIEFHLSNLGVNESHRFYCWNGAAICSAAIPLKGRMGTEHCCKCRNNHITGTSVAAIKANVWMQSVFMGLWSLIVATMGCLGMDIKKVRVVHLREGKRL